MNNNGKALTPIQLKDYFDATTFRYVYFEHRHVRGGRTEIPVEIEFLRDSKLTKVLLDSFVGSQYIYCFARDNEAIDAIFKAQEKGQYQGRSIRMREREQDFAVYFDDGQGAYSTAFSTSKGEVMQLLIDGRCPDSYGR